MPVLRRSLLGAVAGLWAGRPCAAEAVRLEQADESLVAVTGAGIRHPLVLPAARAKLMAPMPCGGQPLIVVRFVLRDAAASLEIAVIAQRGDDAIDLLAVEPVAWLGHDGARLATQMAATGDRGQIRLQRETAYPKGPTLWEREGWTDYLSWRPPVGLVDAPVRAPLAGTRQHALAAVRRELVSLVATGTRVLTAETLGAAGLRAGSLPPLLG